MARKELAALLAGRPAEELLVELLTACEELEVANEELRAQNQRLRDTRVGLEADCRRYRDLFSFAPDGYLVTDLRGTILEANHAAAELLGVEQGHLPGQPLATHLDEPDLTLLWERMSQVQGGQATGWETRIFPPGSQAIDVAVKVSAAAEDQDVPAALCWSIRAITKDKPAPAAEKEAEAERVRTDSEREAALRVHAELLEENWRQRQFLERLVEAIPFGIAVLRGPEHRFELANPYFQAMPGLSGLPLVGHTAAEVFPEPALRGTLKVLDEVYRTGQTVSVREYEGTARTPRENTYWDSDHVPLRARRGEIEGVLVLLREVTEQVHARRQLEELAARGRQQAREMEAIFEAMADGVVVYDAAGAPVRANQAVVAAYGLDPVHHDRAELAHKLQIHHPDGRPLELGEVTSSRALRGERVVAQPFVFTKGDGQEMFILASGAPLFEGDEISGAVVVWHDVTERERLVTENRRQRAFLERLIDATPLGVAVVRGAENRFEVVNSQYRLLTGTVDVPMIGRTAAEVFPGSEVAGRIRLYDQVRTTGRSLTLREHRPAAGTGRENDYWNLDLVPLADAQGQPETVLIIIQDVTEQVQARRQAEEIAVRDQAILQSMGESLVIFDLEGNILEMNPAALRLHGFESVEDVRKNVQHFGPLFDLYDLDGRLLPVDGWPLSRVLAGETVVDLEVRVHNLVTGVDGVWSLSGGPVRDRDGKIVLGVLTIHDVTGQKDLETLLRHQFAFLEQLIGEAPVGIAVVSGPDHRYELANRQYLEIPGGADSPMLGGTIAEVFPEVVAGGALGMVEEVYRTGQTVSAHEYEATVRAGRERTYWNVHHVPLFDTDGQVERVLILAQEVTEQVQARRRIEELAARSRRQAEVLEAIFEAMVEGVVVYDDAHHALRANRAAREAYGPALEGRDRPEIIRLLNLRHLDGRSVAMDESPVDRALRGEVVQGDRYQFGHAQKGDRIMAASAAPLHEGDRVAGAVAVWHDITDEVRAESQREAAIQAVRASEEKLRTLIEIVPLSIAVLDREGGVTHLNPGRAAVLELPSVALAKGTYREGNYIRPDGSPLRPTEFPARRALAEQQVVRGVEFGAVQPDGRVLWANVSAAPLPFDDWQAIVAAVDVTEQMEARQALERRHRELQELTAELEAYDHTVAHDLKNPLGSVMGLADLLAGILGDMEEEGPQRMLQGIVQGTMRMRDIVDALLQLSSARSEAVETEKVDMGTVVAQARQELDALARRRGAQIAVPEEWPAARGYAPWLQRVWANYLSNAIKYGGEPPRIELGAVLCTPPDEQERGERIVRFWVRDYGPGLTEEQQARLFVEFGRLDRPDKLGHGLGLAIVRRVMDRLGGQVGVESRPGEGSTFWFTLPAA